ncbi:MAG: OsmC family protein [Henriciella sp.]|nr:OsmC family protein [Henriciella sp.]
MNSQPVIKSALERSVKALTLKPARGQRTYTNVATVDGGTVCRTVEHDQEITIDVGPALGGEDVGPTPSTVLRAAFSSCIAIGIKLWASREDVPIEKITVVLDTEVDARGLLGVCDRVTPGFGAITASIAVQSDADAADIERVIEKSLRYSTLMEVFCNPQSIKTSLTIAAPEAA